MTADIINEMRGDFLKAMRNIANSVTVVTTDGEGGKQGATVSSFCSVSADPPTLLVCLNQDSRIHNAVLKNKRFCVNVLPENSAELALKFAGTHDEEQPDRFHGIKTELSNNTIIISGATAFECTTDQEVKSGSHTVFIGHVDAIHSGKSLPLVYLDGKFRKIESDV